MLKRITLNLFCFFLVTGVFAQNLEKEITSRKKSISITWGWNWSDYSSSDIHFKGNNHNFTLHNVEASHRPTQFDFNSYFVHFTTPQYNFKLAYFFNDNWNVSFGVDHMKYVMIQNQKVKIDGIINEGSPYDRVYNSNDIILTDDFLTFEHTDGLNYLYLGINRFDELYNFTKMNGPNISINLTEGCSAGVHLPKTNARMFGKNRNDEFHLAGYGLDLNLGLNFTFYDYFFIEGDLKGGFVHMPDIKTSHEVGNRANQHFFYSQYAAVFGFNFPL
ncbi:hypothetical protein [Flammeovirga pacifica]|uniref:Outer membrane protein beta-barrel domain-containing protein n=1 Tax=Flammeovirga pacifica TaxID=915059 RepID=A0A1S1YT60_FLAPC|nr:hypothetical protein [Flammeovirga pacifica]OHX64198.1 hypothetical protein NH26_21580 [Flammeovirga pacifica]